MRVISDALGSGYWLEPFLVDASILSCNISFVICRVGLWRVWKDNIKSSAMTTNYNVDIGRLTALMVAERALTATFPRSAGSLRGSLATEPERDPVGMMSGMPPAATYLGPVPSPAPTATDLGVCSAEQNATALANRETTAIQRGSRGLYDFGLCFYRIFCNQTNQNP